MIRGQSSFPTRHTGAVGEDPPISLELSLSPREKGWVWQKYRLGLVGALARGRETSPSGDAGVGSESGCGSENRQEAEQELHRPPGVSRAAEQESGECNSQIRGERQ